MTEKQIIKTNKNSCNSILNRKLHDAFAEIKKLLEQSEKSEYTILFEKYSQTYTFLLEYTFKGVNDPERPKIYRRLQIDLLELTEKLSDSLLTEISSNRIYTEKRTLNKELLRTNKNILTLVTEIIAIKDDESLERKKLANELFTTLWLKEDYKSSECEFIRDYSQGKELKSYEKSLIVSALTISLLHSFNENKVHTLFDFYDAHEPLVWNRALVGLVLVLFHYNERVELYPKITSRIKLLIENKNIEQHVETIFLQLTKSKETKEISEKLRDEIIPEMEKFKPKMEEKLDLDKILSDSLIEDTNPDWEEIFDEAPNLLDKMQEFSELQLDGSDVFMSAFAGLKHFPFFKTTSNWFIPFYKENADIGNAANPENTSNYDAAEGLEHSIFMCNSDKYSFLFSLEMMPTTQSKMITGLFKAEAESMKDIQKEDDLLDKNNKEKHIFTRYIQDLYRFFNLHPWRSDFYNIFESKLDIHNSLLLKLLGNYNDLMLTIAELNFSKKYFSEAKEIFLQVDLTETAAKRIHEKIGFSFQKEKDFKNALKHYQYAELYGEESLWLIKKIAFSFRKLQQFDKAIEYYRKAENKQPDNLHTQANIAHSYLYSENYEEAFKHYQKVEYFDPNNIKVMRPLAWCAFVLEKFDTAEKYYKKLITIEASAYDHINLGHLKLCSNEKEKAIIQYKKALKLISMETFEETILEDKKILIENSIDENEVNLLLDFLKFQS